ncbi:hypothetical protein AB9F39_38550, partial [Rhizobium leguminosarum]
MLDLNDIMIFARVVEAGIFTAAARMGGLAGDDAVVADEIFRRSGRAETGEIIRACAEKAVQ